MFGLSHQTAQFINLNVRVEKHGDENAPGADIKCSIKVPNDVLSEFHQSLKGVFYRAPEPGEMDMVDKAADEPLALTRLRFGSYADSLSWRDEIVGALFTVHYGTGGKSDVNLDDVTVDNFRFDFMDGGTTMITFRVKCNPDEKQIGKLYGLIGGEIEISLEPPRDAMEAAA